VRVAAAIPAASDSQGTFIHRCGSGRALKRRPYLGKTYE
jgi:hypothetical protein